MVLQIVVTSLLLGLVGCLSEYPLLIVISYDGFRYDFVGRRTPTMMDLRNEGTYAQYINNVFPTKTFPNHHSIATGMYSEIHGVIGSSYYDPMRKQILHYSYEMFHYNEDVIPIWIYNEMVADDRFSAVMMWPGGQYHYRNKYPVYSKEFDPDSDWKNRIDEAIAWILDPIKPANLLMLYFEEPDAHSHAFGPDSPQVADVIKQLDNLTDYLIKKLKDVNLLEKVNLIFLSDHGMNSVNPLHFIDLTECLEPNTYDIAGSSPTLHIIPHEGQEEAVYSNLKKYSIKQGHFKVYRRNDILSRWHVKNNPRAPPILALADEGYGFQDMNISAEYYSKKYNFTVSPKSQFGIHGYDNLNLKMKPFFFALGPKIKQNYMIAPFSTLDLFSLFCEILELPQLPNNGSLTHVQDILVTRPYFLQVFPKYILIASVILTVIFISFLIVFVYLIIKKHRRCSSITDINKRFRQSDFGNVETQCLLDEEL